MSAHVVLIALAHPIPLGWRSDYSLPRPIAMFTRANAALGSNWTLHDLRHTAAYRMVRDPQMPLTDVRWVLGHAHLSTTQGYLNPVTKDVIARCGTGGDSPVPPPARSPQRAVVSVAWRPRPLQPASHGPNLAVSSPTTTGHRHKRRTAHGRAHLSGGPPRATTGPLRRLPRCHHPARTWCLCWPC
jgi:hypothetical protein